jgi:hypothetical protein
VKRLVVGRSAPDLVQGVIDEAEVPANVLIGQCDDSGPQRSGDADPAAPQEIVLAAASARY